MSLSSFHPGFHGIRHSFNNKPRSSTNNKPTSMMFKKRQRNSTGSNSSSANKGGAIIEDLSKQIIPVTGTNRFAIVVHNLLAPEECANLIRRAEDEGFDDALVQGPGGREILRRDIRACQRCIIDDAALAEAVYIRILNAVKGTEMEKKVVRAPWIRSTNEEQQRSTSSSSSSMRRSSASTSTIRHSSNGEIIDDEGGGEISAVGLNERMRFLKYEPGHFFGPHQDIRYVRGPDAGDRAGETSHITVQLYLNDKFKGGTTRFLCGKRYYDVKPKVGSALIFDHDLLHEGSKVQGGVKYSVRTDIMFAPSSVVGSNKGGDGGGPPAASPRDDKDFANFRDEYFQEPR